MQSSELSSSLLGGPSNNNNNNKPAVSPTVFQDNKGNLWQGVFNPENGTVSNVTQLESDPDRGGFLDDSLTDPDPKERMPMYIKVLRDTLFMEMVYWFSLCILLYALNVTFGGVGGDARLVIASAILLVLFGLMTSGLYFIVAGIMIKESKHDKSYSSWKVPLFYVFWGVFAVFVIALSLLTIESPVISEWALINWAIVLSILLLIMKHPNGINENVLLSMVILVSVIVTLICFGQTLAWRSSLISLSISIPVTVCRVCWILFFESVQNKYTLNESTVALVDMYVEIFVYAIKRLRDAPEKPKRPNDYTNEAL